MESIFWTVGIYLATQSIGMIWWGATVTSDIKYIKRKCDEFEKDLDRTYSVRDGHRLETRVDKLDTAFRAFNLDRS